jgi:hypothetical protein
MTTTMRVILGGVSLVCVAAVSVAVYLRTTPSHPARAYAYHSPLNPYHPRHGQWTTLVRRRPVAVGQVVGVAVAHVSTVGVYFGPARRRWKVVAIRPAADDGQSAAVRGFMGPNPVWSGTLVLRPAG